MEIPEVLRETAAVPCLPENGLLFSAGEEPVSAMSESLARALQNSAGLVDEAQLPDEGFDFEEDDPFYCEGTVYTFSLPWSRSYGLTSRTRGIFGGAPETVVRVRCEERMVSVSRQGCKKPNTQLLLSMLMLHSYSSQICSSAHQG
jgi:hypothetical protein